MEEEIYVKHLELAKEMILVIQKAGNRLDTTITESQLFKSNENEWKDLKSEERMNSKRLFQHKIAETIADLKEGEWLYQESFQEYDPSRAKGKKTVRTLILTAKGRNFSDWEALVPKSSPQERADAPVNTVQAQKAGNKELVIANNLTGVQIIVMILVPIVMFIIGYLVGKN